jgi:hypothetical protein
MASAGQALEAALADMLAEMRNLLPPPTAGVPEPNVSIASVSERALAVGNWRGNERRGTLSAAPLKGGRIEAVVRFQFWAPNDVDGHGPIPVDESINELHGRLLAAKETLRAAGFLRAKAETTQSAEPVFVPQVSAWRKTTDYRVLYEFHYQDDDDAKSLISEIPVKTNALPGELMTITNEMARWGDQAANALVIQGRARIAGLTALAFIPGATPPGTVTVTRSFEGAPGLPTVHGSLADFLTAVAGANATQRHDSVTFASIGDFLAAFALAGEPVELGNPDPNQVGVLDSYIPLSLAFLLAVELPGPADFFSVTFSNSPFDPVAVVYLRATH